MAGGATGTDAASGLATVKPGTISMAAPFGGGQMYSGGLMGALQNPMMQRALMGAGGQLQQMQRPPMGAAAPNMLGPMQAPQMAPSIAQTQAASPFNNVQLTPLGAQAIQSLAPWMGR